MYAAQALMEGKVICLNLIPLRTYCYIMSPTFFVISALTEWNNTHPITTLHPSNLPLFDVIFGFVLLLAAKFIPPTPASKK